ncbi:MAG: Crp/Fnr family transcriptional regulator [Lachnospiraceae bacterium]|jgi:CRP-like cAMP-binding protein|nr:Crp/Fnr family transcriptional regulator [Lachnospiraceae bacterium]MCI1328316.1 Crp/Fnr family transcriptional regulator [Lachnospiraceae bacterium]
MRNNPMVSSAYTPSDSDLSILRSSVIFDGISREEILTLLPCLENQKKVFEKGEAIFRAGDRISMIGLLLSGSAHIERYDYWGGRHIVNALRPGDLFGESYAASPQNVINVTVLADTGASVLFLNLSRILRMCATACPFHARVIGNLVSLLARRNLTLNEKLTYVTQHSLRDKILSFLSAESIRQHSSYFDIPFDRQQLADYLNADRSALSKELSRLKKEGIIDYQKNHFHLRVQSETMQNP